MVVKNSPQQERSPLRKVPFAQLIALLTCVVSCHTDTSGNSTPDGIALVRVSGDQQRAPGLATLDEPLVIRVTDPVTSLPVAHVAILFSVSPPRSAVLSDTLTLTDGTGIARADVTLGAAGTDTVFITARAARGPGVRFAIAVSPTPVLTRIEPPIVQAGDTITIAGAALGLAAAPGMVRFDGVPVRAAFVSDTIVRAVVPPCLPAGPVAVSVTRSGARAAPITVRYQSRAVTLALAPLETRTLRAEQLSNCITLAGGDARYLVIAQLESDDQSVEAIDVEFGATGVIPVTTFSATNARARATSIPVAFESTLRRRAAAVAAMQPRVASMRASISQPALGAKRTFEVISNLDATTFALVGTRLRYAGEHVMVWADTSAPTELSDAAMDVIGREFDSVLYPLDEATFGAPSDVDGDGRVHVVLTPLVNALTPSNQCTLSGFVSGFFSAHDLYASAAHSNGAEVFYGFVPDSVGRHGCPHPVDEFARVIRTTFVHELQHVISYQQHVLLRGGEQEATWLNEGLSHVAEELASKVYERRYPPPLGRGQPEQLFPDSSQNFIFFNLVNAYLFLRQPYASSLTHFNEGGTLEERGGAWLFLRWLGDQYGEDVYRRLVQTPLRGEDNVVQRTGEPFSGLAADFALATYADSLPGFARGSAGPRLRFTTRNLRQLFQRLNVIASFPPFPIEPLDVPYNGSARGGLRPGGFVVLSVTVPAGAASSTFRFAPTGSATWSARQHPQISIMRLP